ncbi:J domain-containing protein [Synechococcus sp. PCC 7502]|uniref:J domain-containing protein n=1 Tax=Synechococcus sp. PCC 7502 TaxID=1173263 RepID=UPI0002F9F87E|nr:J domain-containing protein [Synechococcus sp. PCC 7502]
MGITDDYRTLDLEPEESLDNIKQAYRDLAFVWHPDRLVNNDRLKSKAEVKIKAINEAYQRLRFYQALQKTPPVPPRSEPVNDYYSEPVVVMKSHVTYKSTSYRTATMERSQDACVWLD